MHRRPVDLVAGQIQRNQHFGDRVDIRLLPIERRHPSGGLAFFSETDLRERQQHRVRSELEKGPAFQLAESEHSVAEPDRLAQVPAPIHFVGRSGHHLAGEIGDHGQPRRLVRKGARDLLEFIENGLGAR